PRPPARAHPGRPPQPGDRPFRDLLHRQLGAGGAGLRPEAPEERPRPAPRSAHGPGPPGGHARRRPPGRGAAAGALAARGDPPEPRLRQLRERGRRRHELQDMKAMILAAGKGTRVRPITDYVPKPMIPIVNRPVMEFLIELLREHGFDEILVSTAHLAGQIESYFGDGSRFGVEIGYSFEGYHRDGQVEPEGLGSAGGL